MGDGIRMGKEVGADTTGEGFTQMMPVLRSEQGAAPKPLLHPYWEG